MVGASSSFSQSRRQGWESAYVDYETLKLLLTHIELVYEQSNYDTRRSSDDSLDSYHIKENGNQLKRESFSDGSRPSKKSTRRRRSSLQHFKRRKNDTSDYRDELFLESDSSDAFAMTSSDVDSNEKPTLSSDTNFSFDTKGLLYDLDMVSMHNEEEITPMLLARNRSYQATGFHLDTNTPRALVSGGINWVPFTSSQKDNSTKDRKLDIHDTKSSPFYRSTRSRWKRRKRRRVPTHLKTAHAKARAITKRFLGLLSAEVEKVSLFVHARLGELADTMGSLRFANDEGDALGRSDSEYPMSDGGFHSSSSSSNGSSYSSDGDDATESRLSFDAKLNDKQNDPSPFSPSISYKQRRRRRKQAHNSRRGLEVNHDQPRQSKPLFQRSDAVFGEDLSLLSAVDEADGYAAVGVELIHLLRFIMVNTLAVRKLCVKHDKLLTNRMLGGYHHIEVKRFLQHEDLELSQINIDREQNPRKLSIRKDSISEYNDLSTRVHGKAFADYRRELSLRLKANQCKLVGIFDLKLQELMTSATSLSLSESMRQALYEYEVSMSRARALSNLNGSQKKPRTITPNLPFDESAFCYYFPTPRFGFRSKNKMNRPLALSQIDDSAHGDDDDDSTASTSTISLIRLRFVVASILGWQEASRITPSPFQSFLAKTMLCFDSSGRAVGDRQGFYGCSRETLDFLMSYNSDLPLIIDDYKHMLKALQNSNLDDLMLTCLASSSGSLIEKCDTLNDFHAVTLREKVCYQDRILEDIDYFSHRYLFIAFISLLVSTMNFSVIVPSAFSSMGQDFLAAIVLIGSSLIGALISSTIQSYFIFNVRNDRVIVMDGTHYTVHVFICIAVFGLLGNALFSYALSNKHYRLAIAGRILVGATFCEPITLFVVSSTAKITIRSASVVCLKASSVFGTVAGLLLGSIVYIAPFNIILDRYQITANGETVQGLIFFSLWTLIFGSTINLCFILPKRKNYSVDQDRAATNELKMQSHMDSPGSSDSPYYEEDGATRFNDLAPFHKLHKLTEDSENTVEQSSDRRLHPKSTSNVRNFISCWNRSIKMSFRSTSLPVCFVLLFFTSAINEMILNSFSLTTSLHFGWDYRLSGMVLSFLSLTIVPSISRVYVRTEVSEEREIIKSCLVPSMWAVVALLYFPDLCSLISEYLFINRPDLCTCSSIISVSLFLLGCTSIFVGCTMVQYATLSIVSKTTTSKLNRNTVNCGILKCSVVLFGKMLGNVLLLLIWISYRLTVLDFMNFIAFCFLIMLYLGYRRMKKNYFFLE